MVSPASRRELVDWATTAFQLTERRACRAVVVARSLIRYASARAPDAPLRARLHELARDRLTFGSPRLHVLLRREGWAVNRTRVYRLYREEGLSLTRTRPRRRKAAMVRPVRPTTVAANQRWAMDCMHDVLASGQQIRVFTLVDVHPRECLTLRAQRSFRGEDVASILSEVGTSRAALPDVMHVDNGTEVTSLALDHWAYWNRVQLDFSRPAKPADNCIVEAFNGSLKT
jgi:putative transposase